jgi:hypothetical protein
VLAGPSSLNGRATKKPGAASKVDSCFECGLAGWAVGEISYPVLKSRAKEDRQRARDRLYEFEDQPLVTHLAAETKRYRGTPKPSGPWIHGVVLRTYQPRCPHPLRRPIPAHTFPQTAAGIDPTVKTVVMATALSSTVPPGARSCSTPFRQGHDSSRRQAPQPAVVNGPELNPGCYGRSAVRAWSPK